jgi:hypothetical protein
MPVQDFPQELKNLIATGWVRSHPAIDITLDDDTELHLSTVNIAFDATNYTSRLKKVNSIRTSRSRSVDRAEIVLDNADLSIGDQLFEADSLLDNAKAVLHWIYVNVWDDTEMYRVTRISGLIHTFTEEGSSDVNLTLISDDYAGGGVAPFEVKQTCVWKYKDGINCDYAGPIPTCDFSFNGTNGCVVHFETEMAKARYGGHALDLVETAFTDFGGLDTSGNPFGGLDDNLCFLAGTPLAINADWDELPIERMGESETILGVNKLTLDPIPDRPAAPLLIGETRFYFNLLFSDGAELNVTPSHPFYPIPGERVRVKDFDIGMKFRRNVRGKFRTVKLVRMTPITLMEPVPVYNQPVALTRGYWANGFAASNQKQRQEELPYLFYNTGQNV